NELRGDANHRRPPIGSPLGSLDPERRSRAKPPMGSGAQRGMRTTRWVLALVLTAVALGTAAWLITSVNELHDRLARHSQPLALVFVGAAGLLAVASALAAVRMFWTLGHAPRVPVEAKAPEDIVRAA